MKKDKKIKQEKKVCVVKIFFKDIFSCFVFRVVSFVAIVGIIFFLIGTMLWQARELFIEKVDAEETEHVVKIEAKLFEMQPEMVFFEKELGQLEQEVYVSREKDREINKNIRSLSGKLKDIERYYLDRRFDYSLEFLNSNVKKDNEKFEQIKKITRDGELFLSNMNFILFSSNLRKENLDLVKYNFKVFEDNYMKSLDDFSLKVPVFPL